MPDDQQTTATVATGEPTATTPPSTDDDPADQDVSKLKEALRKEREARRNAEKELAPLRTFKQERETAEMTEVEKRDRRIKELEDGLTAAQQRERTYALRDAIDGAVRAESFGHTLKAPVSDVLHFLPADLDPEDGRAVGKALGDLTKSREYLFEPKAKRPGSADAGATGTTTVNPGFGIDRLRHGYETAQNRR